jgi:hypothetical protein
MELITTNLEPSDFSSFRLTCRDVEYKTTRLFGRTFFNEKHFIMYSHSLQRLIDISKSDRLSTYVRHVFISMDHINRSAIRYQAGGEEVLRLLNDGLYLRISGVGREMLAEAFKNLPSLSKVTILNQVQRSKRAYGVDPLYGSSQRRIMDERHLVPSSYEMISRTTESDPFCEYFVNILLAIQDSKTNIQHLSVIRDATNTNWTEIERFNGYGLGVGLSETAFYFPPSTNAALARTLSNVVVCRLPIDLGVYHPTVPGSDNPTTNGTFNEFSKFFSLMVNLRDFGLSLSEREKDRHGTFLTKVTPTLAKNKLKSFELVGAHAERSEFEHLLKALLPTLEELRFDTLSICDHEKVDDDLPAALQYSSDSVAGSSDSSDSSDSDSDSEFPSVSKESFNLKEVAPVIWPRLFAALGKTAKGLQKLKIRNLHERDCGKVRFQVGEVDLTHCKTLADIRKMLNTSLRTDGKWRSPPNELIPSKIKFKGAQVSDFLLGKGRKMVSDSLLDVFMEVDRDMDVNGWDYSEDSDFDDDDSTYDDYYDGAMDDDPMSLFYHHHQHHHPSHFYPLPFSMLHDEIEDNFDNYLEV